MRDPTYVKEEIQKNPEWDLAFTISELINAQAPLGWSRYVSLAKGLLDNYNIKKKDIK